MTNAKEKSLFNTETKGILFFLLSQCITLFGSTLVQMAIVWYVTLKTSSGAWIAAFTICSYLPQFLISFIGGVWADRYNRKLLIIMSDALIALVTLAMVLIMPHITQNTVLLSALLAMSVVRSLGAGVQTPAVNAVIPQLVPDNQLMKFNGINATMQSIVQFAAPAAAGALLTVSTLNSTLLIDVITAAVGIGMLSFIFIPHTSPSSECVSLTTDMKIGFNYAFKNRLLRELLIVYGLFIFLSVPAGFLAQLFVSRSFGSTYWYLTAVEVVGFIGMAVGGIVIGAWGGFKSRIKTLLVGLFSFGVLASAMGISKNFILYLCLMLIYGVALTMVQTATTTLIQESAEEAMQGRVFGLLGSMYSGFLPIGMAIFGPLADKTGLNLIMIGSGVALIVISIVMHFNKHFTEK